MSRFLCVDIGAGTMDVLWFDTEAVHHYKSVVASPVRTIAEQAARLPGDLVVTGCEMGGGPVTDVLRRRAETNEVIASLSAAATLHHEPEKVRSWGITVVEDAEAEKLRKRNRYAHLVLQDVEAGRLERIVEGFGVPFEFDAVAVCVQDHGVPPPGVSHLDFRHRVYRERLDARPQPHVLLFASGEIPAFLNRLRSAAAGARQLPAREVYAMDSGMAAIVGAALDANAPKDRPFMVLDVATSHTVCAALTGNELAGVVEYHTKDITRERLEGLLEGLAAGTLDHRRVLAEGGHGAYIRKALGPEALKTVIATGPKRRLVDGARLPMIWGAPLGDNMMTGCVGLLEALRRRKGMEFMPYA
jgi:uncharacterized protein (DUF1786 family)